MEILIVGCVIGVSFIVRSLYLENKRLNKAIKDVYCKQIEPKRLRQD